MNSGQFIDAAQKDGQKIERLIRSFYSKLPSRNIFIDGGAHHGYHTSYARKYFVGRVISIEASPKTYVEHITGQKNLKSDRPLCDVVPLNSALGCRAHQGKTIDFFFSETHPGRSTVNPRLWDTWAKGDVVYQQPITASVIEVDDIKSLFASSLSVDFIKLDLEGNEINALRGARNVMSTDQPAIVLEFGLRPESEGLYAETCTGFIEMMREIGYQVYSPWAEPAEQSILTGYPFWYLFAFPNGPKLTGMVDLLRACFDESMNET